MDKKIVVVISGMSGCGSTTTGKLLSDKLGLKFFSVGTYFKKFEEGKETERAVKLWNTKKGSSASFHNEIDEMQIKLAKKGNIVIESKLGIMMIPNADFRIWLKAPVKTRAARYAKRDNIPAKEAEKLVKEKEILERENFQRIYGFDFFELEKKADLVVDTSDKKPEEIVEIIISSMKRRKLV